MRRDLAWLVVATFAPAFLYAFFAAFGFTLMDMLVALGIYAAMGVFVWALLRASGD